MPYVYNPFKNSLDYTALVSPGGTAIYGENISFSGVTGNLAHTPISGTLRLYRGGARQQLGVGNDYLLSGTVITLASGASTDEVFLADYNYV